MPRDQKMRKDAEDMARRALRDTLHQNIDDETLKAVAEKIYQSLPESVRKAA